jgi:ATP-dependent Clp protease ATP-binding subunit ClpB
LTGSKSFFGTETNLYQYQMDYAFSEKTEQVIGISQSLAREYLHAEFSPSHLLKALLHKDIGLRQFLEEMGKDFYYMEEWAEVRLESYPKAGKAVEQPAADKDVRAIFREADILKFKLKEETITPLCLLTALSIPGVGFSFEQLKTFNLSQNEILDRIIEKSDLRNIIGVASEPGTPQQTEKKQNALLKFSTELTGLARQGKLDPVVGRDREIRMIAEILGRRSKPNVIIIGDQGVGKTALVNGFAQTIVDGRIAGNLADTRIFELDFGSLIAGASYKGEIEDRLKNMITDIRQYERAILYVDNIHLLVDKQSGASGAANLLKPELDKGTLTLIGTTTVDNYSKTIESDESFRHAFEIIRLEEPDEERAVRMLEQIIPVYEKHHALKAGPDILREAVRLSKRYLKESSLPDSAIDLIDSSMAAVRSMKDTTASEVSALKNELDQIIKNEKQLPEEEMRKSLNWFYIQLKERISPVILIKADDETDFGKAENANALGNLLNTFLEKLAIIPSDKVDSLETSDLAAVVAYKTGVPIGKVKTSERDRLLNIETHLSKRVIGQDHAIKSIAEAIRESRSGLSKAGQPIGSFFFLGPTGTGKTELAKTLAEFLFNDETSLLRFDMSEFKEEHSAALLYGAPPGYVGYEEGGLLVNKIRQKPYSVVLFDEIEKAHTSVFDIFLQILDEGKLHDRLGKEGDFSNAVILFTSNIGSSYIVESFSKGEIPPSAKLAEIMEKHFRPEFLGRLTEIVPFAPISEENVVKIFDIHLRNLLKALDVQGINLVIEQDAKEELARSGFSPKFGARPLIGTIRTRLRRPLSRKIISGEIGRGDRVSLKLDENKELVWECISKNI